MDNSIPYIRFTAPVNQHSAEQLLHVIDAKYRSGATHLHILLSTPGGTVMHGMAIYNFLKGQPIHITMHNFGTVDSIGIVMFCAGDERLSVPHARFLLQPVSVQINQPTQIDSN